MGLDMYAYRVGAGILTDDNQTDFDTYAIVLAKHGFAVKSDDELEKLSQDARHAHQRQRDNAKAAAIAAGDFDPDFDYWRKFNNLHGWMERLYREKGGREESFNCVDLRLMPDDIDRLHADAKAKQNLGPASGFFFGTLQELSSEDREEILMFCAKCATVFDEGGAVVYSSWW